MLLGAGPRVICLTRPAHGPATLCPPQPQGQEAVWLFPKLLKLELAVTQWNLCQSTQTSLAALSWHSLGPLQGLQKGIGRGDHR